MLSYCTNISFYLLLKASGGKVKDHPVIGQLVELRTVMEKIKPLEQKLQYQIDKLVRTANTGQASKNDPLRFKPNPESMLKGDMGEEDETEAKDGVFRPTKIAPVPYEEPQDKKKKQEERLKQKASRSRLLKDLQEEFSERPETHVYVGILPTLLFFYLTFLTHPILSARNWTNTTAGSRKRQSTRKSTLCVSPSPSRTRRKPKSGSPMSSLYFPLLLNLFFCRCPKNLILAFSLLDL